MKFTFINFVVTYKRAILSKSTRHFTSGVKSLVSSKPSYYSVLEIDSKATQVRNSKFSAQGSIHWVCEWFFYIQKEVKEAFLKLTKKWHPGESPKVVDYRWTFIFLFEFISLFRCSCKYRWSFTKEGRGKLSWCRFSFWNFGKYLIDLRMKVSYDNQTKNFR